MSVLNKIENGLGIASKIADIVMGMVENKATDEEIRKRIAEPGGVAQDLIDAIRSRTDKLDDFITNG